MGDTFLSVHYKFNKDTFNQSEILIDIKCVFLHPLHFEFVLNYLYEFKGFIPESLQD